MIAKKDIAIKRVKCAAQNHTAQSMSVKEPTSH